MEIKFKGWTSNCLLLVFLVSMCMSCDEIIDNQDTLTLNFIFEGTVTCESFLAEEFVISLYDETYSFLFSVILPCTEDTESVEIEVEKGIYYIIVELKDANNNTKSFGSTSVDVSGSTDKDIYMEDYKGGITFFWENTPCSDYDIDILKFTIKNEGVVVSSDLWGDEINFENYVINCNAGHLLVNNIESGLYEINVGGYRDEQSERPRIIYEVPEFRLVAGQDTPVDLNKYLTINVSDLKILWEFDSKSIESCQSAGVSLIKVDVESSSGSLLSETVPCEGDSGTIDIFDLEEDTYKIAISGFDTAGNKIFLGEVEKTIEKGNIGKNAEEIMIYIKEI